MRCTIVRSQSRNLSLPQRWSCSCVAMKAAKAGLYGGVLGLLMGRFKFGVGLVLEVGGEVREERAEIVVGKEVMNGV